MSRVNDINGRVYFTDDGMGLRFCFNIDAKSKVNRKATEADKANYPKEWSRYCEKEKTKDTPAAAAKKPSVDAKKASKARAFTPPFGAK